MITSHDLARKLLEHPDLPVKVPTRDAGCDHLVYAEVDHDEGVIYLLDFVPQK